MYSKTATTKSISSYWDNNTQVRRSMEKLKRKLENADAVVIGGGAGLSASAGFTYSGKRFEDNFADFIEKYDFKDMYLAGFYPYDTLEEYWAYWSRYILIKADCFIPRAIMGCGNAQSLAATGLMIMRPLLRKWLPNRKICVFRQGFIRRHKGSGVLYLELGVGGNTPGIIIYPFWRMTAANPKAVYACINYGEAYVPGEITKRSICINADIGEILKQL